MIRAIRFTDRKEFMAQRLAGSISFDREADQVALSFWCPCGCDALARIQVGEGVKPPASPSWEWNGSETEPTLNPSVRQLNCGWHGWLRGGYWESC